MSYTKLAARVVAGAWCGVLLCIAGLVAGAGEELRLHRFDTDPKWELFGETTGGAPVRLIVQDFGWRPTNKAGGAAPGEIGGVISRSLTRAVYWTKIPQKTLNDKLSISGRFAVVRTGNGSGMHFGFFHETSSGWRTPNSLVFRLSGEDKERRGQYSWALADLGNRNWKADGVGAFDGIYQTTKTEPIKSDGKPHDFAVVYDPDGANGLGEISITIDGHTWKNALQPGHKQEGAVFNRFGLMNLQVSGVDMEVYLDDIRINGELLDFTQDPGWEGIGNKTRFEDRDLRPWHDLRWSPTNRAGGDPGEIAVTMWRDERPAYFAAPIATVTLDQPLHAEGRLAFTGAGSDSGVCLGWFNADSKRNKRDPEVQHPAANFLAIAIEGPSRIGHYFRPIYSTSVQGIRGDAGSGPIIRPDAKQRRWSIDYDPAAAGGKGQITVALDGETVVLELKPDARKAGATFDRFGFFNIQNGGHYVKVFIDDVKYTGSAQ
ncbi:MAG TPA: hypothetical protein VNL70_04790 [Tepidisphaeraceae bacterium]|nr:hypothetical protein [Tepidisphaeraceae bacterium]